MNPFAPKSVTTSPEKEDLPPRPLFMAAVLRSLGLTSLAYPELGMTVTRAGLGFSSTPLSDRAAILDLEMFIMLLSHNNSVLVVLSTVFVSSLKHLTLDLRLNHIVQKTLE